MAEKQFQKAFFVGVSRPHVCTKACPHPKTWANTTNPPTAPTRSRDDSGTLHRSVRYLLLRPLAGEFPGERGCERSPLRIGVSPGHTPHERFANAYTNGLRTLEGTFVTERWSVAVGMKHHTRHPDRFFKGSAVLVRREPCLLAEVCLVCCACWRRWHVVVCVERHLWSLRQTARSPKPCPLGARPPHCGKRQVELEPSPTGAATLSNI